MSYDDENITENAYRRIKAMVGGEDEEYDPVKDLNLTLTTQDRLEIYNDVLNMLHTGEKPQDIAQKVVGILNAHIAKVMKRSKDRQRGKSPIFRRVE